MAAEEHPDGDDDNVRVWSTTDDASFTIERGQSPRFSRDSRWVSAIQRPPTESGTAAKPLNKRAGQTLVLLNLRDGSRRMFEFVLSYDWTYTCSYLVYLQSREPGPDGAAPLKGAGAARVTDSPTGERETGLLHAVYLEGDTVHTIENVSQHLTHQTHADHQSVDLVSYVVHDERTDRDTLHIAAYKPGPSTGYRGKYIGESVHGQQWALESAIMAFMDSTESAGQQEESLVSTAIYTYSEESDRPGFRAFTRLDLGDSTSHRLRRMTISANGVWVAAEERLTASDSNVHVWSTEGDAKFSIERAESPRISRDSRWVIALQRSPHDDARSATPNSGHTGQTLVLLDTRDGSQRTFDDVSSYELTHSSSHLAYWQSTGLTPNGREMGTLHMVPLDNAALEPLAFQRVVAFASEGRDETTDHFAYVVHDEATGRERLYVATFNRPGSWGIRGTYQGEMIEELYWARDAGALGFLDTGKPEGHGGKHRVDSAPFIWRPAPTDAERFSRVDTRQ